MKTPYLFIYPNTVQEMVLKFGKNKILTQTTPIATSSIYSHI